MYSSVNYKELNIKKIIIVHTTLFKHIYISKCYCNILMDPSAQLLQVVASLDNSNSKGYNTIQL